MKTCAPSAASVTLVHATLAQRLRAAGRDASQFDPAALSPVLIAADLDGSFSRWLPLRADPEVDCFATVVAE